MIITAALEIKNLFSKIKFKLNLEKDMIVKNKINF
jgi:hypothetical protein